MVTNDNQNYCGGHFEMYSNTVSLCVHHKLTQILKNKQVSRLIEKDAKSRKWREGKLNEGSQKVQCFSNKINKDKSCNVQCDKYN